MPEGSKYEAETTEIWECCSTRNDAEFSVLEAQTIQALAEAEGVVNNLTQPSGRVPGSSLVNTQPPTDTLCGTHRCGDRAS